MTPANFPLFETSSRRFSTFVMLLAMSLVLYAIDLRLSYLKSFRFYVQNSLFPSQLLLVNINNWIGDLITGYVSPLDLLRENETLRQEKIKLLVTHKATAHLESENKALRGMLALSEKSDGKVLIAEALVASSDPQSRKIIVNKGLAHGIHVGMPVLGIHGLIGQVTRTFNNESEVTILTHLGETTPVKVKHRNISGIVAGMGEALVEFRFFTQDADINIDDILETSGLDGIFEPNIPVAKVVKKQTSTESGGGIRILASPLENILDIRFVAIATHNKDYMKWVEQLAKNDKEKVRAYIRERKNKGR